MAIKQMNYLDISMEARKKAGSRRLAILRPLLAERSLPAEQREKVQEEIRQVSSWVAGELEPQPLLVEETGPKSDPESVHYVVDVMESLSVKDD